MSQTSSSIIPVKYRLFGMLVCQNFCPTLILTLVLATTLKVLWGFEITPVQLLSVVFLFIGIIAMYNTYTYNPKTPVISKEAQEIVKSLKNYQKTLEG